jgi:Flp pilus assembly protein TadG
MTKRPRAAADRGQILIMTALMLPALIGFMGLALDVGYAYDYKQQMQIAADSAAVTAALLLKSNSTATQTQLDTAAQADATGNGFTNGSNSTTVTTTKSPGVNAPCNIYSYLNDSTAVRVQITQPQNTFLAQILGFTQWSISACAVANAGGASTTGVVVLDSSGHPSVTVSGGSGMSINGDMYVDSTNSANINISGGSTLSLGGLYDAAASCTGTGNCAGITPTPTYNSSPLADPLASRSVPTATGGAQTVPASCSSGNCTLQQGTYTSITLNHNSFGDGTCATFSSGVYVINGNFTIQSGQCATGSGVTFYVTNNGQLSFQDNNTRVTFSAPTSGTNEGMLIFQDRTDTHTAGITSGVITELSGILYVSDAMLNYSGGGTSGSTAAYTIIVVKDLQMQGGSTYVHNDFSGLSGGDPIKGGITVVE